MTTEILYNTLFQKKMLKEEVLNLNNYHAFEMDIEKELGCVVFDVTPY